VGEQSRISVAETETGIKGEDLGNKRKIEIGW
jgi:hypothetical protein